MKPVHLIIDCGATSAKIVAVDDEIVYYQLPGFSPHHQDWSLFQDSLTSFCKNLHKSIADVKYYGTGITSESLVHRMTTMLSSAFDLKKEHILVNSDLMASAHAAYRGQPVIVGILGTGSNIGYFDGKELTRRTPSLGYLIADEGSGVDIGVRMLKAFVYGQLPVDVMKHIHDKFGYSINQIIDEVYSKNALRPLVSPLSLVAFNFKDRTRVKAIIKDALNSFVQSRLKIECHGRDELSEVHLFGSVAFAFKDLLSTLVIEATGKRVLVNQSPIEVLAESMLHI